MAKRTGRPSSYTKEAADLICEHLALGKTLPQILELRLPGVPEDRTTIYRWTREHEEFRNAYVRARQDQMDTWVEDMIRISNDDSRDVMRDEMGRLRSDNTAVNRDKLRCDTIKFIASRLHAKKYGDKVMQEITGPEGGALLPVLNITIAKK